ncbi:MAG TPA: ABC-F family ATP-binding cassette domain-containing protein [Gemmatimonadaceae bacterium]|nr:ABC-F family ATP-binding cassette domain-containing protein [Gemmatimonadaceae bacterium]
MTLISASSLSVRFGAMTLFSDVTFTVAKGERWAIIGRNGSGKTTLFKLLAKIAEPESGTVTAQPGLRLSMMEQHREFGDVVSIWETAAGGRADLLTLEKSLADQGTRIGEMAENSTPAMLARYDRDLEAFQRQGGYELAPKVDAVLHGLGFDPDAARTRSITELSGGERGRLGLARQLINDADVMLLDEPTNHLDLDTIRWLTGFIQGSDKTFLIISHDRAFMSEVVDHVLHIEGETAFAYTGTYESFIEQRQQRREAQTRAYEKQRTVIEAREDYVRRNIAGQNSKQAKGRRKLLERLPRLSPPPGSEGVMGLELKAHSRGGDQVALAREVSIGVPNRILIEGFTNSVRRGDRLGLLGPNGAGKSTLLKTLVGDRQPDSGEIRLGESIVPGYYRQDLSQVPLDRPLYDLISEMKPGWERRMVQGHLGRFGFSGDEVQRTAENLSGGERARVALAMIVLSGANLLILDEPTNHLDVESIEALEDAIKEFEGTVIVVSHDRELLRSLTTRVWVLHNRHIIDFGGGFSEWEQVSDVQAHAAAINASEEVSLRKVQEKKKTGRAHQQQDANRKSRRDSQSRVVAIEQTITRLEGEIARITNDLADPELYLTRDGIARSVSLGTEMDRLKTQLDAALEQWALASDASKQ